MGRTLNGEVLIDDEGNLNESLWLYNLVDLYNHYGKNTKEQEDGNDSR